VKATLNYVSWILDLVREDKGLICSGEESVGVIEYSNEEVEIEVKHII
jgi:hypothetical protein